jgi:hypothetical protein
MRATLRRCSKTPHADRGEPPSAEMYMHTKMSGSLKCFLTSWLNGLLTWVHIPSVRAYIYFLVIKGANRNRRFNEMPQRRISRNTYPNAGTNCAVSNEKRNSICFCSYLIASQSSLATVVPLWIRHSTDRQPGSYLRSRILPTALSYTECSPLGACSEE